MYRVGRKLDDLVDEEVEKGNDVAAGRENLFVSTDPAPPDLLGCRHPQSHVEKRLERDEDGGNLFKATHPEMWREWNMAVLLFTGTLQAALVGMLLPSESATMKRLCLFRSSASIGAMTEMMDFVEFILK